MIMRRSSTPAPSGSDPQGSDSWGALWKDARRHALRTFAPVLIPLVLMWGFYIVKLATGNWINIALSLDARSISGLVGILFMPLLHGSFSHLLGNTFSWLILGGMTALLDRRFLLIMGLIWLLTGAILWVIGTPWLCHAPDGYDCVRRHVGASGVIYGFGAFLVAYGFLTRRISAILVALFVLLFHGLSMLAGILPLTAGSGVSWTGHLSGAIAGVVVAFLMTKEARAARAARASP
ncbi:rhomboid family intramembrane serine protease [Nesterenkonia sp. HG001]|nr:rhomboid family intramembrane serine protease [Nesterenkonia sp. HG001]